MSKLIPLFLLSVSVAFGSVIFDAGSVTVDVSGLADDVYTPVDLTIDQWVTTAGPIQSGFLYIYGYEGTSSGLGVETNVSIGGVVTGSILGEGSLVLSAPSETPAYGLFLVPFTLGIPFEITAYMDLSPVSSDPHSSLSAASAEFQVSVAALTGYYSGTDGNELNLTGSEAIEAFSSVSAPEPGTAWLLLGAGVAIWGAKVYISARP